MNRGFAVQDFSMKFPWGDALYISLYLSTSSHTKGADAAWHQPPLAYNVAVSIQHSSDRGGRSQIDMEGSIDQMY